MGLLAYVPDDGYTEDFYVNGVPRIHPAVRGRRRPMPAVERAEYVKAERTLKSEVESRKLIAGYLAKKFVEWDLRNAKGELVPITAASMLSLKPQLFDRLFFIMVGDQAADEDPERPASADEIDQDAADLAEALRSGRTPADVREARDAKNSPMP